MTHPAVDLLSQRRKSSLEPSPKRLTVRWFLAEQVIVDCWGAYSDQDRLSVALPGSFAAFPGRGAPRLHVFQGRDLNFEFRSNGVTELLKFSVEHFNRFSRNKQPYVNPPLRRNLAIPLQGSLDQLPVFGPSGQILNQGLQFLLHSRLAYVHGPVLKVNRDRGENSIGFEMVRGGGQRASKELSSLPSHKLLEL